MNVNDSSGSFVLCEKQKQQRSNDNLESRTGKVESKDRRNGRRTVTGGGQKFVQNRKAEDEEVYDYCVRCALRRVETRADRSSAQLNHTIMGNVIIFGGGLVGGYESDSPDGKQTIGGDDAAS